MIPQTNSAYNVKRKFRDYLRMVFCIICLPLYFPHLFVFIADLGGGKSYIISDLKRYRQTINVRISNNLLALLFFLHTSSFFRTLFYFRIGPFYSTLIGWYRKGDKSFIISKTTIIGKGFLAVHPFSTIINADCIGDNFHCKNCTTIASKHSSDDRPIIGNDVALGANVCIIGPVKIGDNVVIGAGSVVVKDIPSNCVAAGNPAVVIKDLII